MIIKRRILYGFKKIQKIIVNHKSTKRLKQLEQYLVRNNHRKISKIILTKDKQVNI